VNLAGFILVEIYYDEVYFFVETMEFLLSQGK